MRNRILITLGVLLLLGLFLRFGLHITMARSDLHISAAAEPLACIGGERVGEFCRNGTLPLIGTFPVTNSLVMTLFVDALLLGLCVFASTRLKLVPTGFQNMLETVIEGFYNFARSIDPKNIAKFFALPATIFIFFLIANVAALVPGIGSIGNCVVKVEKATPATEGQATTNASGDASPAAETKPATEPSAFSGLPGYCGEKNFIIPWLRAPAADLNVTFAFSLVAMFLVEFFGFQALGWGYLTKFFNFKEGPLGFIVGLLELISEFSRIISFAFRMFGNIFGGEVILVVMSYLFAYLLPLPFYGFELFVALIQAFIFAVLTLIFFSVAVIGHGGHEEHAADDHGGGVQQLESDVGRAVTTERSRATA